MKIHLILLFTFFTSLYYLFLFVPSSYAISLDSTFGNNGKVITAFGKDAFPSKILLQPDGKPIVGGYILNGNNRDWALTRYKTNGSLDESFGNNGIVLNDFGGQETSHGDFISSLALQQDGKIIVGGSSATTSNLVKWTLARYLNNGTLDPNFGTGGITITTIRNGFVIEYINKLIIQPDNKIIAIGVSHVGNTDAALARYNSDGTLDSSFGINGIVTTPVGNSNDRGIAGLLQSDGKIIVFGDYNAGGHDDIFLLRYNSDGTLDNSFGANGKVTTQIGAHNGARDILLQPDGKIVVTGGTNDLTPKIYLARYNYDGSLDNTFGTGGKFITSFANSSTSNAILLQNGKFLIGGYENIGTPDFSIYQFNSDGSLDTSFANNGSFTTSMGSGTDEIRGMTLQNDGKVIAVGNVFNGSYNDWGMARFSENDMSLPVPLLKQTSSPWQGNVYDKANTWSSNDPRIYTWGCALTSAAMVLKFHGINKLPDGTLLDPGTLNTWLNDQIDGYIGNGFVNWLAISRLSKQAKVINGITAFDALEYNRVAGADTTQLTNDIKANIPDILEEPGHFVVGKGISQNSFSINDPFYDRTDLASYSDTFTSLNRFVPSHTNLSYIMVVLDTNIEPILKTSSGSAVGETFIQNPLTNPLSPPQTSDTPKKILYLQKPEDDTYILQLSSNALKKYNIQIYLYDQNGNVVAIPASGVLGTNNNDTITIKFKKSGNKPDKTERSVTFKSIIYDIKDLRTSGDIKKEKLKTDLVTLMEKAEKITKEKKIKKNELEQKFDDFKQDIKNNRKKDITEEGYQILLYDLQFLKDYYLK